MQKGFAAILIILIGLAILGVAVIVFFKQGALQNFGENNQPKFIQDGSASITIAENNSDEPPLKLKSIGVNFEDFKFTKQKLEFGRIFMDYGFVIPGNASSSGRDKTNPQPTFVVPLGTPVRSIVDGVVVAMPILWSGDYSIQLSKTGQMDKWIFETEHLVNPKVKVGDKVAAGQIVGEVSNFNNGAPEGFGTVEIGMLKGGQVPQHVCPFA